MLDVVELLARSGNARLRFSDIVRELDVTQATAHAILKTLCDRGWASRDPVAKTFTLGPALAVVAARTDTARPLAHAARSAALRLSREVGYAGSVVERFGDSLVVTAFEGDPATQPAGIPGDRIPYAPPFGVALAAWDTEEEQRAWIRRGAGNNADRTLRLERVLQHTRERGFDVDWTTPALAQAVQVVGTLDSDQMPTPVRHIVDQLLVEFTTIGFLSDDNPGRRKQPVVTIAAPIFDHRGHAALMVAVHPLCPLNARQIRIIGKQLNEETTAITESQQRSVARDKLKQPWRITTLWTISPASSSARGRMIWPGGPGHCSNATCWTASPAPSAHWTVSSSRRSASKPSSSAVARRPPSSAVAGHRWIRPHFSTRCWCATPICSTPF